MKKGLVPGTMVLFLAACGAPVEGDVWEPTAETQDAITIPDDPLFPLQWGLRNTGQLVPWTTFEDAETFLVAGVPGVDINAALAWDTTQGASDILIGIGERSDVDIDHEDLTDQIFRNNGEIAGDGIDNDGNGCIDDDHGCDFVNQDGVYDPGDPHATHVAGIAGGRIKNGRGIAGVAPKAKLVPLTALVEDSSFLDAIDYAESLGIRVMNVSQGFNSLDPSVGARMASANILFVCSGGNRGTPRLNFPAVFAGANILGVSNVTNIGEISDHSSYGPDHIDIAAPGRSIISTFPDDDYEYDDGTSMAAPHVAGVAALVMKRFPNLTVAQVADRLTSTAMRMTTMNQMVRANGMVDARAALEGVGPIQVNATSIAGRITLSWNAQPGATRYDVERDGTTVVNNGTATTHAHSGLAVNSGHIYRVRAIIGSSTGAWSHRLMAKASTMPFSEPYVRESRHPYQNDIEVTDFQVRKIGATRLRVHFSRVDTLPNDIIEYDRQFLDERETLEGEELSGSYPTGFWTHWLENQDVFRFTFRTDASGTAFGYSINRIEYFGVQRTPTQIAIGTEHSCVRVSDGAVRCWGENGRGQLGLGNSDDDLEQVGDNEAPAEINDIPLGASALSVTAGHEHNCALLQGGSIRCWGNGTNGQLGYGNTNTIGDNETPASAGNVPVGGSVIQVSAGNTHTCAVLSGGAVRCWGNGATGRLGYGNTNSIGDNETPASAGNVNVGGPVAQIAAGGDHTCALLTNGTVRCWGANGAGQLGYGNTNVIGDNETPASAGNVNLGGTAIAIDLGLFHSCALLTTGQMRCWGSGSGGALGYGNTNNIGDNETPASAGNVNVGGALASISVGTNRTCAILTTGGMRCWGQGGEFPLGYGNLNTIGNDETPASVGNISLGASAVQAAAGEQHICALLAGGEVRCWGDPAEGRLGLPDFLVTIGDNELPTAFPTVEVL